MNYVHRAVMSVPVCLSVYNVKMIILCKMEYVSHVASNVISVIKMHITVKIAN